MVSSTSDLSGVLPFPMGVPEKFLDADFGIPLTEKLRTRDSCEAVREEIYRGLRISVFELDTVSVFVRKFDTALGGCICVVGVEGREIGCCLGSGGGKEGDAGGCGLMFVRIFGSGGVAEGRREVEGEDLLDADEGWRQGEDVDVGTGGGGVGVASEADGIRLELEFADRSNGGIEGGCWVNVGVNVGESMLSAGIAETASGLGPATFVGNPLVGGEIFVPTCSPGVGTFNEGEGDLCFMSNRKLEPLVS